MIKNYILTAFRQFWQKKIFTILNVLGLSTGMAVFVMIMMYVDFEFSFDKYHEDRDRIFRIYKEDRGSFYMGSNRFIVTPAPLAPTLKSEYAEVEFAARINDGSNVLMTTNGRSYVEKNVHAIDPDLFNIFTMQFLHGNPATALNDPNSIVISESTAQKYFGRSDAIGENINYRESVDFTVSGIINDMPSNSHFRMHLMIPYLTYMNQGNRSRNLERWNNNNYYTYLKLVEGADYKELEAKLPLMREKFAGDSLSREGGPKSKYIVQPLAEAYLFTEGNFDIEPGNDGRTLYIFSTIAFLILLIACINYMNMATAMSVSRAKEVGIRKTIGAGKSSLVAQFIGESVLISILALTLSIIWVLLALPAYNSFLERELTFNILANPTVIWLLGGSTLVVALLSGAYPALALASYQPVAVLKGDFAKSSKGVFLRNTLVIAQFAISGTLILCTIVVKEQLSFIHSKDMGYDRELVVDVLMRDQELRENWEVVRTELLTLPSIVNVSKASSLPNNITSQTGANWIGRPEDKHVPIYVGMADENYIDLFSLELVAGDNLTADDRNDERGAFLINEMAAKEIGWENPMEEMMLWNRDTIRIAGVIKDFHQHSLHLPINPLMIYTGKKSWGGQHLAVKISSQNVGETIYQIENLISKHSPNYPFEYRFFDEVFDRAYNSEARISKAINVFSLLTVVVACLGLYGLALFLVQQKIKEVGIRKVLGASIPRIVVLLNKNFTVLILVAFTIAASLAYFIMDFWLSNFAYHVEISPLSFALTLLVMLVIGWLTVGYQTMKAANTNPVEVLKDE